MRLAAWNANHNARKRSFKANLALLDELAADVIILSETAAPEPADLDGIAFIGSTPGLAVVARNGYVLSPHPSNAEAPAYSAGFAVSGPCSFDLLAVWPVSRKGDPSYHQRLMAMLDSYAPMLSSGRAVMAGDFNSSTRVTSQKRSHPRFVDAAASLGLVSAFHHTSGEAHGEESVSTYLHGSGPVREFHIDYCFVSDDLMSHSSVEVDQGVDWFAVGDHRPIVLEVPDAALSAALTGAWMTRTR